jgi:hypothetical protein
MQVFDFILCMCLVGLAARFFDLGPSAARLFGLDHSCQLTARYWTWYLYCVGVPLETNSLAQIGIMLVSFALGWGLITLFSRRVTSGICLVANNSWRCSRHQRLGPVYWRQPWQCGQFYQQYGLDRFGACLACISC